MPSNTCWFTLQILPAMFPHSLIRITWWMWHCPPRIGLWKKWFVSWLLCMKKRRYLWLPFTWEAMKCLMELGCVLLSAGRLWMNMEWRVRMNCPNTTSRRWQTICNNIMCSSVAGRKQRWDIRRLPTAIWTGLRQEYIAGIQFPNGKRTKYLIR